MRPRVRSYGDSSTFTRSPGRMRMKFIRILPLTWASTRWPFSNSTRNIAFGSGSTTVPSTSIASSLVIDAAPASSTPLRDGRGRWSVPAGEDVRTALRDRDRVLEVRGQAAVLRHRRPPVVQHAHLPAPHRHHGLDGQDHARLELRPPPGIAEVRDLRLLVQRAADAVSHEGTDDPEAVTLHVSLHRVGHVGEPAARPALLDGQVEAFARDVEEFPNGRRDIAERHRER